MIKDMITFHDDCFSHFLEVEGKSIKNLICCHIFKGVFIHPTQLGIVYQYDLRHRKHNLN